MTAPLQGCNMGRGRLWWPLVVVVMAGVLMANTVMAAPEPVEEVVVSVDTAKSVKVVDERFLSLTIDPAMLLFGKEFSSGNMRTLRMARGLAPAYLRLAGPDSNHYHFQRSLMNGAPHDNYTITEVHWIDLNHFAREAGLDLVVCLNILERSDGVWDSRNSLHLVSFSNEMGYNVSWQLGYELQELGVDISAAQFGQDVAKLRHLMNTFPRYRHSLILGPDITKFKKQQDVDFLINYLHEGGSALDGITWHPEFTQRKSNLTVESEDVEATLNQLIYGKDMLSKILEISATKKPLWIGDGQRESSQGWFLDALTWADKLGVAAQMGVQVIMRQPDLHGLFTPTPDYWVSLVHKALVGRVVLDVKQSYNTNSHIHMFCHCTHHYTTWLFGEAVSYKHGAITCFGINHWNTKIRINLKLGSTGQRNEEVHQYLLTSAGNGQKSRETLLNGKPLNLEDEGMLPVLSPDIHHTGRNIIVTLPPASIGFWVLPDVKVKPCLTAPFGSRSEASSKATHHSQVHSGEVRGEFTKQYSDEIKRKRHSKKPGLTGKNITFSSKDMKDAKSTRDVDDFESGNTNAIEESDVNVKSENFRRKRNDIDKDAHGRYRRYVLESGKYMIPGLQPDYFQPSNGVSIRNLIRRRNQAERLKKLARTSKQDGNIPIILNEPHHHVSFEDMNDGFPVFSSDEYDVNPFPAGTIYIRQSGESSDERNRDYDYIDKDENMYEEDENVLPELEYFHGPAEYFEIFQKSGGVADEKLVGYGTELSEAESIVLIKSSQLEEEQSGDDEDDDKVIQEQGPTEEEDRKTKAATDSMLHKYFSETYKQDFSDEGEDFETVGKVREKNKTDLKKEMSNSRKAEERKSEYSDEVISKMAHNINEKPDSSIHTVKTKKATINDHSLHNNDYDDDGYVPVEEVEITRRSHKIMGTATEDHDKNNPSNAKEYYKEGSRIFRTRRQGKGNSKNTNQSSEEDDQDSYDKILNHASTSASQGTTRQSKGRARKVSHRVIYGNSDEDDSSSDTRRNYSKQTSKNSVTQKLSQRRSKDRNEHVESESEPRTQSHKYNVKSRLHNQETLHKTQESHEEIDSSSHNDDDIEEKVMKTYSKKRKYERTPYHSQQNVSNNKVYKGSESDATMKGQTLTENINPSYRKESSRRGPSNAYRTTGQRATQNNVLFEEQDGEESNKYMRQNSRKVVTSSESEERSGIDEEEEEATEAKIKANKSWQRYHATMRQPASNRELRYRVRRDAAPQLPVLVTSVENGQKETDVQNKDTELETVSDLTNAKLQIKARDVKENKQLETASQNVPTAKIISSNEALQWNNTVKSNKGNNKQIEEGDSAENYITLKECEGSSGSVHKECKDLSKEINKNPQQKMNGMSLDRDNHQESKGPLSNSKVLNNRSLHYMASGQLQNDGYVKQVTGTSPMYKPSDDITINGSTKVGADEGDLIMTNITTDVDGAKKFHKTEDDALNMKLYQDPGTAVIRLPKAVATHTNLQHRPTKVDAGVNDLISMKETPSKNIKNTAETGEKMEKNGEFKVGTPEKMVEFQHADESNHIQEDGKLSKVEQRSALTLHDLVPASVTEKSNEEMTVSVPGVNESQWTQNQEINQSEHRRLHSSEGQEPEKESLREEVQHDGERERLSHEETMQRNEIENVKIPLEAGKQRPVKGKTSSEEGKCETVPEVAETQFGNTVSFQSLSNDVAPKQTSPINSKTNSDSSDATATEPSESQVRIVMNKLPVNDGIKGNIHSNSNRTGTNVPKSSHALKLNSKNVHDKVMKAEDEVFKITDNIRGSRSAQQSLADGDPDNHGLTQTVDNVPEQFKIKNGAQKQHHMLGAEGGLKNIPHSMKGNVAVSSDEKETDGTNGKLENLAKNYIADDEDVSAAFVRNAKHTGHLTPISPRREKSHIHRVDKANAHTSLHPSSLARSNHIKAELEKRRLERFHALAAHRAKLKEDLLKIRAMAAEGKLKLPHHIIRRDTTQDENTESLMSDNVLDDASDHVKLQLPTVTKTEKIKAELEKKRLERLHVLAAQRAKLKEDLLKMKVMATEGKLKLPHHIIRRDTTQDENTESLMSDNVLDDASDHVKLQLPTVTKTEKIKAELEKKRLERLHFLAAQRAKLKEDFLKMKVMATEGKLKLPHHIRRRDTTQDENTEPLMSDTESTEFHPLMSIRNEDRKGYSNRDNPSLGSQNVRETDSDLSSHKQERNDKHFPQDTHSWLEQVFLPVAMVTDQRDVEIPAFDSQQVYKPPHDSETEILARNYVSGSELVHVPNHEGKALVEESKILNSATSPFFMFYDMGPKQKYVESLLQEGQGKERDSGKENVSQETILNSSPDQRGAEDESSQGHYVEIKQLSLPFLISRSVLKKYPMMKQSKNMPISENDIQFIFDLETDEADDDVGELMREQTDMSPILRVAKSDYGRSIMRPEVKDDASLSEKWEEQDAENTRGSLMPVSEETDPNHPITLKVDHLPEELNKTDAGWDKRQENGMNIDGSKYENKKSGGKYFKSSNKIIQSSQSLNDVLDEVNPTTMRTLKTMEDIEKDSAVSKNNMFGKNAHSITLQSVTQDLGTNSELMPGSGNSHIVPIRSKRALAYQFKDKFSDDLLNSSILVNKDNSEIEDNMNGNKYINVIMPGSKALSFSNVTSENNILSDMKKFKYNSDSMPANSLYVRDDKLISDYASKDLKPVSHEKRAADQSHLESLGNYLNDIINVETDDDTGNNKLEDALNEISEDVNLQTNEINRRFRTSDSFVKYKLESNRNNGDNEQNITETKIIPYELHKHVLNSNYAPRHRKIWKYLYLPKNKHLAASSEELPSIEYFNPVNKTGNRSSPSDETSPASKDIFSVILGEFPNISSKSTEISKTSLSNNTTITAEETPKTATELKDVSKFPMSRNVVTNTDTEYVTEPNVKKWNKESSLISETHPKDEFNYPFRSMKSITASEQKPGDLETVTNTKENSGYLVIMDQNTEHIETPKGKKRNDKNQEENKQITTTGHIHKFIKNVADHVVRFFHKLSPWNYFRY